MNKVVFDYLHCGRKIRYKSESRAQKVADQQNKRDHDNLKVYHCKICEGWHLGHDKSANRMLFLRRSHKSHKSL